MVTNWETLANVGSIVLEIDAITAAVIGEAVQSHARDIARKKEFFEAQTSAGSVHGAKLCDAESILLADFGRAVGDALARAIACDAATEEKRRLFAVVRPTGKAVRRA